MGRLARLWARFTCDFWMKLVNKFPLQPVPYMLTGWLAACGSAGAAAHHHHQLIPTTVVARSNKMENSQLFILAAVAAAAAEAA